MLIQAITPNGIVPSRYVAVECARIAPSRAVTDARFRFSFIQHTKKASRWDAFLYAKEQ